MTSRGADVKFKVFMAILMSRGTAWMAVAMESAIVLTIL